MRHILSLFASMLMIAAMLFAAGCKKDSTEEPDVNNDIILTQSDLLSAVSAVYSTWETTFSIPETVKVGSQDLTAPQFQYALCKLFTDLVAGTGGNVKLLDYKAATHPENDSYDQETIAVSKGPKNGDQTEDLNNVALRMLERMAADGQVPNNVLFSRTSDNVAFCTNRAVVCMARAIAAYKADGKFPDTVSTDYLSASATLLGFAKEFVSYLDVWKNTTGDVDADGSHCTANHSVWKDVHFIPIPYSGGYQDGTMYSDKYQPYHTITVNGVTYDAAQCWEIALKGILDVVTKEGSSVKQTSRNTLVHTLGDGKAMNEHIPALDNWAVWGAYPFYEKANDPCAINFSSANPCTLEFLRHSIPWFLTRAEALGKIGNFQTFNSDDPDKCIAFGSYKGNISSMRMLLIAARFYKYIVDNKITTNVYSAMKDVKLDYYLYGTDVQDLTLITSNITFDAVGGTKEAEFIPVKSWTAKPSDDWLSVSPASGDASVAKIKVTAKQNTGDSRKGNVIIESGDSIFYIRISQAEQVKATIKDFAQQYISIIDTWSRTTGTINFVSGETPNKDLQFASYDVAEAHYVPLSQTTITVKGKEYNTADMLEMAERAYLLLRGYDGTSTTAENGTFAKTSTQVTMNSNVPEVHNYKWNNSPYNEGGSTKAGNVITGNGGHLMMGNPVTADGVACKVKLDILDNFAQRHLNYPITHSLAISNICSYSSGQLNGYYGTFCAFRALMTYAFFFKYMLDNNLSDATKIAADVTFRSEELGTDEGSGPANPTIKDFAKQYVTLIDKWIKTTGMINLVTGEMVTLDPQYLSLYVRDAHYVPLAYTTITVGDNNFNTADMLEIAERAYLLLRGYDGTSTTAAKGTFAKTSVQTTMESALPQTHSYRWGDSPYNESGSTKVGNVVTGNGGHLMMGNPATADGVACKVKLDILDNFAQRHLNYPITHASKISNLCGYSGGQLSGYYGTFCAFRALMTYAFFFRYMLDNNLSDATKIGSNVIFHSEELGTDEASSTVTTNTLWAFAKQFVTYLDVWGSTVGTVDADNSHTGASAWTDVHFIPIPASGGFVTAPMYGTKYQPYHTITVNGVTYSAAQCWEVALKGLLDMITVEGSGTVQTSRNTLVHTLGDGSSLVEAIPTLDTWATWGPYPYYEKSDDPCAINFSDDNPCTMEFLLHCVPWFLSRSSALGHNCNFLTFGTTPSTTVVYGNYKGNICSMRLFLIVARYYKYLLDHNISTNVYTNTKDIKISYDLYGK